MTHLSEGGVGKDGVGPAGAHPTGGLFSLCLPLFAITTSISIFLQVDRYEGTLSAIKIPQVFSLATCLTVLRERTICFKMGDSAICSPMAVEIPIEQRGRTAGCLAMVGYQRVNLFNHMPLLFTAPYLIWFVCFMWIKPAGKCNGNFNLLLKQAQGIDTRLFFKPRRWKYR